MAISLRRNGLSLRMNGPKHVMMLRAAGRSAKSKSSRNWLRNLNRNDPAAYELLFKQAGGQKALDKARKNTKPNRAQHNKKVLIYKETGVWPGSKKKAASSRPSAKKARKSGTDKRGRKYYMVAGKRATKAAYDAAAPKSGGARRSAAKVSRKSGTDKLGRKYYMVDGKRATKAAYVKAGKKSNPRRRRNPSRRSFGSLALKLNPGSPVGMLSGAVDRVPFVGPQLAPMVAPLLLGAGSIAGLALLQNRFGDRIPAKLQYLSPAIGGVVAALILKNVPVGSQDTRNKLAVATLVLGGGLSAFPWVQGKIDEMFGSSAPAAAAVIDSSVQDDQSALGALALKRSQSALGAIEYGAIEYGAISNQGNVYGADGAEEYSDASPFDAEYAPGDFNSKEGRALLMGPSTWWRHFGKPGRRMYNRTNSSASRHAGKQGHRWAWLVKLVGFQGAQKIAGLSPDKRIAVIKQLRHQARLTMNAAITGQAQILTPGLDIAESTPFGALMYMGQNL